MGRRNETVNNKGTPPPDPPGGGKLTAMRESVCGGPHIILALGSRSSVVSDIARVRLPTGGQGNFPFPAAQEQ